MNTVNTRALTKDIRHMFNKMSVGFDEYWMPTTDNIGYPPYNLIEESKNVYRIEMAVAGFAKDSIEIFEEDAKLTIIGNAKEDNEIGDVLHKGLAQRKFTREFTLAPNIEVTEAKLENGVLILRFLKQAHKNRKVIDIA
ncbi:MAG: Hsp20 family protein [SAR202 cluster bacterium]|jgi:molecular chaperone IbpA|nr:Hsp20 family protein [SAR202 cluster bacterium]|tara:strand:- start:378 stop:794 length:417 start_codon:yes stop_codon:yes gene_type:complete